MPVKYPTKDEIFAEPISIDDTTIKVVNNWKKEFLKSWKDKPNMEKLIDLKVLLFAINMSQSEPVNLKVELGPAYCCVLKTKTIYFDPTKPSIISALHEYGHILYGSSELKACRWSVILFKTCFPTLYEKLTWKGHLLVKQ